MNQNVESQPILRHTAWTQDAITSMSNRHKLKTGWTDREQKVSGFKHRQEEKEALSCFIMIISKNQ